MSMGVVDSSEFDAELIKLGVAISSNSRAPESNADTPIERTNESDSDSSTDISADIQNLPKKGRPEGRTEVPESLRSLIGQTAIEEGRQSALSIAGAFGISDSSVGAYSKGATSTSSYNEPSEELKAHLDQKKLQIQRKASKKLFAALKQITPEKLENTKAKDLSSVAKDMSVIIRNMEPEITISQQQKNQFVLFAPIQVTEDKFDVIEVNE